MFRLKQKHCVASLHMNTSWTKSHSLAKHSSARCNLCIVGGTGDHWISLLLNHQGLICLLAVGRYHELNKPQRWLLLLNEVRKICQKLDWTTIGLSRALSGPTDTHFSAEIGSMIEGATLYGIPNTKQHTSEYHRGALWHHEGYMVVAHLPCSQM